MTDKANGNQSVFQLLNGTVRVWIEPEEAIYMMAVDAKYRAPVELSAAQAMQLAAVLQEMAGQMED